ncbi:uncharacterized protein A1O5_01712 [Cladophialophora psammophila CBS 110553]|uniref:Uncharacterized protein n=1 Tax=Cladophialophora psammophila CBS 110553 TaxID=1182543 RepID=W9XDH5_9EURO|nr:uncharacterized protein A1O5_01712 [Cladophialophora psammophila CBS 110553]EXJ75016.1 hypothetical protein A1O5_01712 [Cladophialophora psammophila CBS 110553]
MPGFSAPYMGLPDPEKRPVESMETSVSQPATPERRSRSWYKKLGFRASGTDVSGRYSLTSMDLKSEARSKEAYLNKPLPALPQPPYFEYLFADAGLKAMKSKESMKSSFEANSNAQATTSNGPDGGYILDTPDITQFAFAHAGVDVTTKDIVDNHFASLGTSLEGYLNIDINEELEREKATESFFGGVEAREGPSPNHVPVVDEDGFDDRREGLEDWPQLWQLDKETLTDYEIPGSENFSIQFTETPAHYNDSDKPILKPRSQKTKEQARLQDPSFPDSYHTTGRTINALAVQPVQAPRPLTIRKKAKKRNARDSFVTKSTASDPNPDDHNIHLLFTKKIRVAAKLVDEDVNSSRAVSVCGSISDDSSSALPLNGRTSSSSSATELTDVDDDSSHAALALKRKRLTAGLTGYPGQFESYEADYLRVRATRSSTLGAPTPFTMGDPLHPNNEFTHTNFVADPTYPSKNYTKADLDALPVRALALTHAEGCAAHAAAVSAMRTDIEETLRREVHRECAAARLEGVSVGQYRYYQGFMSLEEYVAARICVCWDFCWCSKLCTIYADVLCPCSEWIGVHGDD